MCTTFRSASQRLRRNSITGALTSWRWQDEKNGNKSPDVEKVIAVLQQIKDQDRNLIMHPELVLSGDDAFTLFEVGQGAIIAMAARLKPKAPRKPSRSKVVGTGGALKV